MSRKNSSTISPLTGEESEEVQVEELNVKKINSKASAVLFRIKDGIGFPHFLVIILNLFVAIPLLLIVFVFLLMVTFTTPSLDKQDENDTVILGPKAPDYGFPGKLYCASFIGWSLLIEFGAQLIYSTGSGLLVVGALKKRKAYCYAYVGLGIISFLISALIRAGQFLLCDKEQMTNTPGRIRPYLPQYFKLTFIWLICQIFWYWIVLSLVAALLNWIQNDEVEAFKKQREKDASSSSEKDKY